MTATMAADALGRGVPQILEPLVRRPRLELLLADGTRRRVTLVSAPPGSGKTTLLASWFAGLSPGRARWVTTGAEDDDGLEQVLDDAAATGHQILVIDDVHHLTESALSRLAALLAAPPPGLDLVLAGRADPPIALSHLRLRGSIREIRGAALAFTREEARELLCRDGLHVRPSDVTRLHARTEGWVAGLRLILCALERGATAASLAEDETAAQAAVSDYLLAEVLERETPEQRRFLLRTSITDQLTPELAVLLADDPRGGTLLEDLYRRGVFVVALDHGWYRYHALFAALLRARLRVEDPTLVRELHRWAACWFAARDLRAAAEKHARAGEHWTLLGDLLRRRWRETVLAGSFDTKLVDGLPRAAVEADAVLSLLANVEPPPATSPTSGAGTALADETAIITRLRACAESAPEEVPEHRGQDAALRRVVGVLDAELALAAGDLDAVLQTAGPLTDCGGWIEQDAKALVALALAIGGSVGPAGRMAAEVTNSEAVRAGRGRVSTAATVLCTAICDSQLGHRPDRAAITAIDAEGSWALRACARPVLTCRSAAASALSFDPVVARHPLVGQVLVALGALDVTDTAGRRVAIGGEVENHLLRARHALATDAPHAARAEAESALAASGGHPRSVAEAGVILAVAADAAGDTDAADEAIAAALVNAARTEQWAPFVAHAASVAPMVDRLARRSGPHQPIAIEVLERLKGDRAPVWTEPLTERESTVLHLLPSLMSNEEIAEAMHLSVNTVKTHLKALYRKLAVDRRRDAVMRARELDLL